MSIAHRRAPSDFTSLSARPYWHHWYSGDDGGANACASTSIALRMTRTAASAASTDERANALPVSSTSKALIRFAD